MSKLELILLGRFECLLSSGKRVTLAMRKAEVLLAYLALSAGMRHPRERLINLLWSDRGEEQARNSLRQCLSAIRKSLGEAADLALKIDRTTVCLNAEIIEVDVHEFERLASAGEYETLVTAADLYQGEFLEGIAIRDAACQEWLDSERERFRRQFIEILHKLAETQLVSHDYANAIRSAERLVEQDPLAESGWRLLMQSYAASGDRNHALQAFKRCQQALKKELDVDPEQATVDLREQIAGGGSRPVPAAPKAAPRTSANEHSIVVLPFDNLSGDPQQEYFSDGITDSIIMNLALFPGLSVKSRNSSFAFKQQIKSIGEISRELGVDYLVEGSVRRSSGRIRVNVQLIDSATGNQVWGKRYDSDLEDLFELEEDLSRSIATTITGQIESDLQRVAISGKAADQQAYDLLLAGNYYLNLGDRENVLLATEAFDRCLSIDPDNARVHANLFYCHDTSVMDHWSDDIDDSRRLAAEHIKKAISLDPDLPYVQVAYANYLITSRHRFDEAERQLQRALSRNPNDIEAITMRAVVLSCRGQAEAALEQAELTLRLDPYHPWANWIKSEAQFFCGRYEECIATVDNTDNAPGFVRIYAVAARVELGRTAEARRALAEFLEFCRNNMRSMPRNIDEWRDYYRFNAPFTDPSINDRIIDLLVEAGLGDEGSAKPSIGSENASLAPSIAVLPFDNLSGDPQQEYFSDGITESIILNLALFPGLQVKSRNSSFAFKQQLKGLAEISHELDVDYVVEGSIRKAKDRVRITAQLIDAASGNQVWGKRYEAELDDLFELEEDLSREIAATVTGRIKSELQRIAIAKSAADQKAYDLLLAGMYHVNRFNCADNAIAIEKFERCLAQDPDNVRAYIGLYICYSMAYFGRWLENHMDSFDKARDYIRRALMLDPEDRSALLFHAEMLNYAGEQDKACQQIDKVLKKNPNDTDALAVLAAIQISGGDFENAHITAERALKLDPYHPWAEWELAVSSYHGGNFEGALEAVMTMRSAPGFITLLAVAALVRLERIEEAREMLREFMRDCEAGMKEIPRDIDDWIQYTQENYPFADKQINRDLVDTLVKAGLDEYFGTGNTLPDGISLPSILVMPFVNLSGDPEQEYFSDGITESLILNLGSFPDIRVKSRHASFAHKDSKKSIDDLTAELGVGYVVEGSIRKSADTLRITVQLTDAADGNQVWGRRFDSTPENLFDLEQELCLTIAATVSGRIEKKSRLRALQKPTADLRAYDYYMRGRFHIEHFTAHELRTAVELLEKCLTLDPDYAPAHGLLGMAHLLQRYENMSADRDRSLEAARRHLERSLEIDPHDAATRAFMAEFLLCTRDFDLALVHARKSVELNPALADGYSMLAWHAGATGQYEQALEYARQSMQIDQFHPYAGWNAGEIYRLNGDYQRAIDSFRSMAHLSPSVHAQIAACFAGLDRIDEARLEMRKYLGSARAQMYRAPQGRDEWYRLWEETVPCRQREETDRLFELLLRAGLCDEPGDDEQEQPSIAVLPFENMSGDPEQEHFADGITTDIIATLAKFRHLRTVSRYSTLQYKQDKPPIADIAVQQGVRYVLEGSVRKSGERIRVSAELIDSDDGQILWNERFDRDLDDLFAVQDEITRNIALAMKVQFDDGEMARHRSSGASDIRAWELTLIAADLQDTYVYRNIMESRKLAQEAIRLDPDYAFAWVVLAWTHFQETFAGWCESFEESIAAADEANRKALEIDPDYGEAWSQAGTIATMKQEPDAALEACRKAVEIEPGNAEIQTLMAMALQFAGAYDEARKHCREVTRLCPMQPNWYYLFPGHIEMQTGNPQKAISIYRQGVEVEAESPLCRFYLVDALFAQGDEATARIYADEIRALDESVKGRGLVRSYSADQNLRQRLRANLEIFDLY